MDIYILLTVGFAAGGPQRRTDERRWEQKKRGSGGVVRRADCIGSIDRMCACNARSDRRYGQVLNRDRRRCSFLYLIQRSRGIRSRGGLGETQWSGRRVKTLLYVPFCYFPLITHSPCISREMATVSVTAPSPSLAPIPPSPCHGTSSFNPPKHHGCSKHACGPLYYTTLHRSPLQGSLVPGSWCRQRIW